MYMNVGARCRRDEGLSASINMGFARMSAGRARSGWNRDKIVARIRQLHARGEDLSYNRMSRLQQGLLAAANYHFGSWAKAVNAAGLDYATQVRRVPKWSKEKVIQAIQKAHREGADLSWTNVTTNKAYSALAYAAIREERFGSWDNALRAAGLDPARVRRYESWSREKIVQRIKRRAAEGRPLNSKAMQQDDSKLFNAALNYFGAWEKALRAAGQAPWYETLAMAKDLGNVEIRRRIRALERAGVNLAAPNMRKHYSSLYSAACKYFGSWTAAREACGIRRKFRGRE